MKKSTLPHASRLMKNSGLRPPFFIAARDGATIATLLRRLRFAMRDCSQLAACMLPFGSVACFAACVLPSGIVACFAACVLPCRIVACCYITTRLLFLFKLVMES
ncbi:hypothetical protein, partial [uncultured Duncaniella sp.]|uniref:hypothetical protein n=1 Tax=uncultured Duncaniella sp. TaxID=2768039 RepID=UPI00265F9E03